MNRTDNPYPNFRWTIYYEHEGNSIPSDPTTNPTVAHIVSDLSYIQQHYANQPSFLKVNGKPVIFVYGDGSDGGSSNTNCLDTTDISMTHRWYQANAQLNNAFYIVLKVFSGYANDPCQPSSWHQYSPAVRTDSQGSYSYAISPGFWLDGQSVRLTRDLTAFDTAARSMVSSNTTWKLTETWNEWGEGSSVEPGDQVIQGTGSTAATLDPNGTLFKTAYIDTLNRDLPSLEQGTGAAATPTPTIAQTGSDPVIAAAGDMVCGTGSTGASCAQNSTANLILSLNPTAALALGDTQYEDGTLSDFQTYYTPSWGQFKSITYPAVGNHEYLTTGASGYYTYFGSVASPLDTNCTSGCKGYYSYNIGNWHLIAINSNCSQVGGCAAGSPQETWLKSDLAAHTNQCTLAYWHHPRYSSGGQGSYTSMTQIWQDLYDANADLVLVGHDHDYERFAPQDANGNIDTTRGIVEIVAGTGGRNHTGLGAAGQIANSQVFNSDTFGVLKLTMHPSSYDWQFLPASFSGNGTFTESGSQNCH